MRITNNPGLSSCWVKAVEREEHEHSGWMSMTELLSPPQLFQLRRRHDNELQEDVSDLIWSLFGKSVHYVLQQASTPDVMTEQRFNVTVLGKEISCCPDRVEPMSMDEADYYVKDGKFQAGQKLWRLKDFKMTKVWAVIHHKSSPKWEWVWQVNGYAWALAQKGFPVAEAAIEAGIKDWSKLKAVVKGTRDYPRYGVESLPIDLYPLEQVQAFLEDRVRLHEAAWDLPDEALPECTMSERWAKPDRYAVKKAGSDKALPKAANFETRQQAQAFLESRNDPCEIEFRKGASPRCEEYCPCRDVCSQWATKINPPF